MKLHLWRDSSIWLEKLQKRNFISNLYYFITFKNHHRALSLSLSSLIKKKSTQVKIKHFCSNKTNIWRNTLEQYYKWMQRFLFQGIYSATLKSILAYSLIILSYISSSQTLSKVHKKYQEKLTYVFRETHLIS